MSTAYATDLKKEIRDILIEDPTYLALMGSPASAPYQTFYLRNPEKPTFPETVYSISGGLYSQNQARDILSSIPRLEVQIKSRDSAYEDIAKRIIKILHKQPSANLGFRAVYRRSSEIYDDEHEVYGRNLIFDVHFRRPVYK